MRTTIRKAAENDVAAVLPLWCELMELHTNLDPQYQLASDAVSQAETHLRTELVTPTSLLIVAERGSSLIGYCRASVRQNSTVFERRVHGFTSELHVSPCSRRQGIGRRLFQEVPRWLAEQGVHRVELITLHANHGSRAFWQSVGCEPCAERRFLELAEPDHTFSGNLSPEASNLP